MAGTRAGGIKTAIKNQAKDPDFYRKIGAKGGRNGHTGGFAANPELARIAGAKGGRISSRKVADKKDTILETVMAEKQQKQVVKPKRTIFSEIREMFQ